MDLLYQGVVDGRISLERWVELCSTTPARMFGLYGRKGVIAPGADADVVVYDPNGHTSIGYGKTHHMNMDHSAWEGFEIDGHVDTVLSRGTVVDRRRRVPRQQGPRPLRQARPVAVPAVGDAPASPRGRPPATGRRPPMDFGVVLQCNPPASRVVELARQAENLGFDYVWTFDSHLLWEEPFVIYSQILAETRKVTVGPMVTNPATRDWTVTASLFATLNEMYGNRTVCGIGRGDSAVRVLNGKPTTLATLRDCIHVIRELANGREVEHQGSTLRFPWGTESRLPVWVAAYGPKALALAGEVGDGFILQLADPSIAAWTIKAVREAAERRRPRPGRDHDLRRGPAYVGDDLAAHARPVPVVRRDGRQPRRRHRRPLRRRRVGARAR